MTCLRHTDRPQRSAAAHARHSRFGCDGFTLIELIVAASIIAIGILGTISSYTYMAKASMTAQETTVAANAARAKVDELQGQTFDRVVGTYAGQTVTFDVPGLFPNPAGRVTAVQVGAAPTVLEITVTIAWQGIHEPRTTSYSTRMTSR